jgi:D-sedoheptulose 7-phosphate isomerase
MEDHLNAHIGEELRKTRQTLDAIIADTALLEIVERVSQLCVERLKAGNKVMFAGNGGSAADAQHLAGEFVSRFAYDRPGLAGIAITTDTSVMTAIGNDYGYDYIFARQIESLARPGDVFFAISTSGKSPNIVAAIAAAKKVGVHVVGMTGQAGGVMAEACDWTIRIPSLETPKIQEGHIVLGHIICGLVERGYFPR